ncbi:hypothetical protein [Rubricoccus marinus]|uniref:hypothetical protein n=1 Tax=Rubricoccus marinus TaxID=716817 RepID=UPI00117BA6CA|nr:hypothetical protein [Rubricoccus marinus]
MARPKGKRGFRPITVDGNEYRWRLNTSSGLVEINLADTQNQRLAVDVGWRDPWLDMPRRAASVPLTVTPRVVESAIRLG